MADSNGIKVNGQAAQQNVKPLRAMLARGAACDTCRARKVKCDGEKPCAQCVKSSRGDPTQINCVYEAGLISRAGAKKRSAPSSVGDDEPDLNGLDPELGAPFAQASTSTARPATQPKKRQSTGSANRVDALVERINELERKLRLQSQPMPAAVHTHPRASASPPFYSQAFLAPSIGSPGAALRRTFSVGEPLERPDVAQLTPESSLRLTGKQLADPPQGPGLRASQMNNPFLPSTSHSFSQNPTQTPNAPATFSTGPSTLSGLSNGLGLQANGSPLHPHPMSQNGSSYGQSQNVYLQEDGAAFDATYFDPLVNIMPETDLESPPSLDPSLLQLLYPGWPITLPSPGKVDHLVGVFFSKARMQSAMLSKPRLMLALRKTPMERGFPEAALLHAICAVAACHLPDDAMLDNGSRYWPLDVSPRDYHYRLAVEGIQSCMSVSGRNKGEVNFLQVMQAVILACFVSYCSAKLHDLWLLSGFATRLAVPMRLNHLPAWDFVNNRPSSMPFNWAARMKGGPQMPNGILAESADLEEHSERQRTFWMAFAIDRHASAATEFSSSLDENDIQTPIPTSKSASITMTNLHSPEFMLKFDPAIGSFGQYIKAMILLGRVSTHMQRRAHEVVNRAMADWINGGASQSGGSPAVQVRKMLMESPEFKEVDKSLSDFRATTSINFIDSEGRIDGHLVSAYVTSHVAQILFLEPFVARGAFEDTSPLARCSNSAKCIMSAGATILSTSNDLSALDPFLAFAWIVAARALIRHGIMRRKEGDEGNAKVFFGLAQFVYQFVERQASIHTHFTMASIVKKRIRDLLDEPERLLPPDPTEELLICQHYCDHPSFLVVE